MKILILANNDIGLYKFRKELIEEYIHLGHKVIISLPKGELIKPFVEMGCDFIDTSIDRRGINPIIDIKLLSNYLHIVKQTDPDLVITYTIKPNIYGGFSARLKKKKYAVNITGLGTAFEGSGAVKCIAMFLYKIALKKAKVVFFENSSNRDALVSYKCCDKEKTVVLNGAGVNTDMYCLQPYPLNDNVKFLFVGRIMKEKGVDELLEAMKRLTSEGEKCTLDILGEYEENYREIIEQYQKEGWLNYHGVQKDVRPFYRGCDCFVLPSYHEGMANTNLEACASGRPIITSDIPGCREAVTEKSGLLCEPKSVDSLYNAMKKMIKEENRKEMGLYGRKHMEKNFDKKKVVQTTIQHLFS